MRLFRRTVLRPADEQEAERLRAGAGTGNRGMALLSEPAYVAGLLAHYAKRWWRLYGVEGLEQDDEVLRAAKLVLDGGDLLTGFNALLDAERCYAAAGGADALFVQYVWRQFAFRYPAGEESEADVARLRDISRSAFVREFTRRRGSLAALSSDWAFSVLGRFNPGDGDLRFYWGGAIEPMFHDVPSIGPGYDQSALRNRPTLVAPRDGGRRYEASWEALLRMRPRPWLVHLETWNEYFEGSDIGETVEFGRDYIEMTRRFADRLHAPPGPVDAKADWPSVTQLSAVRRGGDAASALQRSTHDTR